MENDDVLRGRLLSRREMLALLGGAGLVLVVGCSDDDGGDAAPTAATRTQEPTRQAAAPTATSGTSAGATSVPSCVVQPELTEGPYFVDTQLDRSDIRTDPATGRASDGVPLALTVAVSRVGGDGSCEALPNAIVDVWQCDALGVYSGVVDFQGQFDTQGQAFLRGFQRTDTSGMARFTTIYPGWYAGRATHIHFKIRTDDGYEYTSQWFFDDALSDEVNALPPYAQKGASGRLPNQDDGIYNESGGQLTLDLQPDRAGYAARFDIGLQIA